MWLLRFPLSHKIVLLLNVQACPATHVPTHVPESSIKPSLQSELSCLPLLGTLSVFCQLLGKMEDVSASAKTPADFLKSIKGKPVVVKLNSGVDYRGEQR